MEEKKDQNDVAGEKSEKEDGGTAEAIIKALNKNGGHIGAAL